MDQASFQRSLSEIGPEIERRRSLAGWKRTLHQRTLRHFADIGRAPDPQTFQEWAAAVQVYANFALATLVGDDVVEADLGTGQILGAYPFAAQPRGYRVDREGQCALEAYCAADALGIAALLNRDVTVTATDPYDATAVRVHVRDGQVVSQPPDAVIGIPADAATDDGSHEPAGETICPAVSFYASAANVRAYGEATRRALEVLTLPQALLLATVVFGGLLDPAPEMDLRRS